ncbi:MAG: FkbM family methyltransferase [Planctomycetaceae bacterium]
MKQTIRRLRSLLRAAVGRDVFVRVDARLRCESFGAANAPWDIVTDELNSDSVVYSFGVGEDASFDMQLIERFNLSVHAFDPTPKSIEWVQRQNLPEKFILHEYGVADFDGTVAFYPPENPDHVSHTILNRTSAGREPITVPVKSLRSILHELNQDRIDVLKMDIEGAEYDVIRDIFQGDVFPKQILVEFHHRFPGISAARTRDSIEAIRAAGYRLFSISASNEEFCFIR